jgi:hypothetical protein
VNGRCAYITKLEAPAEKAKWADDGAAYVLVIGDKRLEVRRASDNVVTAALTHPLRVTALAFLPPAAGGSPAHQHVLTACDDGQLRVVDGADGALLSETATAPHCGRVKEAVLLRGGGGKEGAGERRVVTASSDGRVVVWSVDAEGKAVVAGAAAGLGDGVRITCLAAYADGGEAAVAAGKSAAGKVMQQRQQQQGKQKQKQKGGGAGAAPAVSPRALALPVKTMKKDKAASKKRPAAGEPQPQQPPQQPQHKKHKQKHQQRQHQQRQHQHQQGKGKRPGKDGKGRGGSGQAKSEGGVVSFI